MCKHIYSDEETNLDASEDDPGECPHAGDKVEGVDLPQAKHVGEVDEGQHGGHDDGRKDHRRSVLKQRHQEHEDDHHRHRHDDVRQCGLAAGVGVDRRPRERP